ncbi:MAG TPA: hypothetical protein PKA20_19630 [Burkholderiaceae bacterium]|nr:hypothetical protein [Burkholderiaceae bacterium]
MTGGWVACHRDRVAAAPEFAGEPWATLAGYGNRESAVTWHDSEAAARHQWRDFGWVEQPPRVGERHWVGLGYPFWHRAGVPFWCVVDPARAVSCGYDDWPGGLSEMRFVRCRVDGIRPIDEERASAVATIEAVLGVADLIRLPLTDRLAHPDTWHELSFAPRLLWQGELVLQEADSQGPPGAWALLRHTPAVTDLLVLGRYGMHYDEMWAGRVRVREGDRMLGPGLPALMRHADPGRAGWQPGR